MRGRAIIIGIIVVLTLAGLVWYYNQQPSPETADQTAALGEIATKEELTGSAEGEFILGSPQASVTLIEYSSPLCGHCVNFHRDTLPLIINKYIKTGKVKLIPRLLSPPQLSTAALCAHEQGNFWNFNEYLFEHSQELKSVDDLKAAANSLGLNQEQFNQCFDEGKYREIIMEWFNQADEAGVEGTPTFFVNDRKIVGNQLYAVFEEIIDQELAQ